MKAKRRLSQLPASQDDITIFVEWLIEDRNVKAGTVKSYLAGIRQMHIVKGMDPPVIRSAGIQWVLKGKKNAENISARRTGQDGRLPMTVNMMKLLKETIRVLDEDITWKLLLWAVCCGLSAAWPSTELSGYTNYWPSRLQNLTWTSPC